MSMAAEAGDFTDSQRETAKRRIRNLQDKTVERGCTAAEADSAARKAAGLMRKYGFTEADIAETAPPPPPIITPANANGFNDDDWEAVPEPPEAEPEAEEWEEWV